MTPAQRTLYFREWGRVVSTCKAAGWPAPDRHEFHARALGVYKSSKSFTNQDLDLVLAEFRSVSQPDNLVAQIRAQEQPRIRLVYGIRHLVPEAYWRAIARDKFGTDDLDALNLERLHQLRITLAGRINRKAA